MILKRNKEGQTIAYTRELLEKLIDETIREYGLKCDLNFIDTSRVTDMSYLFDGSDFIGNISKWDTGNVTNMSGLFSYSKFSGDISKWNTGKVEHMHDMFLMSDFSGDISGWNIENVQSVIDMFQGSPLEDNPPRWYKDRELESVRGLL